MAGHIGLIGGIGPAATVVYYRALVRLHAAAGRPLALTIAHADLGELVANLEAGRAAEQAASFARHAEALRAGGCALVAVTSMGGHFCRRDFERVSPLPPVDAVAALGAHFAATGLRRVGVLGTAAVMGSRLYGLPGVEVVAPEGEAMARVDADYKALARAGAASAEHRERFRAAGAALMARGAEAVLLGGTDLSLAFDGPEPGYPVIDSAEVHAAAIARRAMEG